MNTKTRNAIYDIITKLESLNLDLKDILTDEENLLDFSAIEQFEISEKACELLEATIHTLEKISNQQKNETMYTFKDFTVDTNNETIITDNKLWISLFNPFVNDFFKELALEKINEYITEHQELVFDKSDILVGILQADMSKDNPLEERFNILIFIENEGKSFEKDCTLNIPISPNVSYFKDFKELVMEELEKLIFA